MKYMTAFDDIKAIIAKNCVPNPEFPCLFDDMASEILECMDTKEEIKKIITSNFGFESKTAELKIKQLFDYINSAFNTELEINLENNYELCKKFEEVNDHLKGNFSVADLDRRYMEQYHEFGISCDISTIFFSKEEIEAQRAGKISNDFVDIDVYHDRLHECISILNRAKLLEQKLENFDNIKAIITSEFEFEFDEESQFNNIVNQILETLDISKRIKSVMANWIYTEEYCPLTNAIIRYFYKAWGTEINSELFKNIEDSGKRFVEIAEEEYMHLYSFSRFTNVTTEQYSLQENKIGRLETRVKSLELKFQERLEGELKFQGDPETSRKLIHVV